MVIKVEKKRARAGKPPRGLLPENGHLRERDGERGEKNTKKQIYKEQEPGTNAGDITVKSVVRNTFLSHRASGGKPG